MAIMVILIRVGPEASEVYSDKLTHNLEWDGYISHSGAKNVGE